MTHAELVKNLSKPGDQILSEMTPACAHLWHMASGIAGEAGELLDCIKKHVVYRKPLDRDNLKEELGDLEYFMEGVRQETGITREECIEGNVSKLLIRYPNGYTNKCAQERADKL